MHFQVGLDRKVAGKLVTKAVLGGYAFAPETLLPLFGGTVGNHAQFSGQPLSADRRIVRAVIAVHPIRILANHLTLQRTHGDSKRQRTGRRGDQDRPFAKLRMSYAKCQRAHPAHRATDRGMQFFQVQVSDNLVAAFCHIFQCQYRKGQSIQLVRDRIDGCRTGRAEATAQ